MAHFTEAIRLNPGLVTAHFNLGLIREPRGEARASGGSLRRGHQASTGLRQSTPQPGRRALRLGNYKAAKAEFAEAIRLDPGLAEAYTATAMLMAACPDAKFRDSNGAVQFATRACELTKWKNPVTLDALAAAQAEAGDYRRGGTRGKRGPLNFLGTNGRKPNIARDWCSTRLKSPTVRRHHDSPRLKLARNHGDFLA